MANTRRIELREHIVEIVSDSGEGAQKAAVTFAEASAKMGNGLWTVEVIPSEIQPPPHTTGATSGNRIRLADRPVTNVGDTAAAGPGHPIRVTRDPATGEPSPYVLIRRNLEALIDRKSFYRMVELCVHHDGWFGVWSSGTFFPVIPSDELP